MESYAGIVECNINQKSQSEILIRYKIRADTNELRPTRFAR